MKVQSSNANVTVVKKKHLPRVLQKRMVKDCDQTSSSEEVNDDFQGTRGVISSKVSGPAQKRSKKLEFISDDDDADSEDDDEENNRNAPKCTKKS